MEVFKNLFNGKGYIDGITIIDSSGEILFTAKFNNKLNSAVEENYEIVGKKFFDIYENLNPENSTIYKSMTLGVPLYTENQTLKPRGRNDINITSLSIPIKSGNKIIGAIDLSSSEEKLSQDCDSIPINPNIFNDSNIDRLENKITATYTTDNIISQNKKMLELKDYINIVANCDLPVMIYGETGTGKELFAQSIHNASSRKEKPFIAQNCAAIPENLLESILFGTAKGAFTGAVDNVGLLNLAEGGTLFLDEINSMPIHLQSKLLRVLQEGTYRSIGGKELYKTNVKIISAINVEPFKAIECGELRRDIFYRLSVMKIDIPPLRDRTDDIPLLVNMYIAKYNQIFNKSIKYVSNTLYQKLQSYNWPGNIRELEHVIIYGMSIVNPNKEKLSYSDVQAKFQELVNFNSNNASLSLSLRDSVDNLEKSLIEKALQATDYNISKASQVLEIPRQTLQRKIKYHKL